MKRIVSVGELAAEIYAEGQYLKENFSVEDLTEPGTDFAGTDCRLQIRGGSWSLHTGSADFDQDHGGSWACSAIPRGCSRAKAREIAKDLIDEAMSDYAVTEGA